MALDASVGASTSDSYGTLAEAETYFAARTPSTAWDNASEAEKEAAMKMAVHRIDQERFKGHTVEPLNGTSADPTQALAFPRHAVVSREGWTYLHTVIPEGIKRAQYEIAYAILDGTMTVDFSGMEQFDRARVGPLEVDIRHQFRAGALPEAARRELSEFTRSYGVNAIVERA